VVEKWRELAEKNLETGDRVQSAWPAQHNRQGGYIVLSDRKLLFVAEKGLLSKTVSLELTLPYQKIGKTEIETGSLIFTEVTGSKHAVQTVYLHAVKEKMDELARGTSGRTTPQIAT